jgi:hypothetical protein
LVCVPYSIDNLHKMAKELGISRAWFHSGDKPHYDIPKKRIDEITKKCELVSSKEILKIIKDNYIVKGFDDFVSEAMTKWNSPKNNLTLDEIKNLPSYSEMKRYGWVDVSNELQKSRLNFRFMIPVERVRPIELNREREGRKISGPHPTEIKLGYICLADVNQRSGRIQVYYALRTGNPNADKQEFSGANMIKSLNRPIETLEDYDIMFKHLCKYIEKKLTKRWENTAFNFTKDMSEEELLQRQEEVRQRRIDYGVDDFINNIW